MVTNMEILFLYVQISHAAGTEPIQYSSVGKGVIWSNLVITV